MAYFGPMVQAQAFWQRHGFVVPVAVNSVDYFLDLVTPGTALDAADELVTIFRDDQLPVVEARASVALQNGGLTLRQMVGAVTKTSTMRSNLSKGGGVYTVSYAAQLFYLFNRKLYVTFRSPATLALPLLVPTVQGLLVGYMFQGIGQSEDMLRQMMFIFCLLTMLCLAGTMSLAVLLQERTLMKYETSEALYCESCWALTSVLVDVPLALLGATCNVVAMAYLAQMELETFEVVFKWALMLFFVYDSLFACIGAVASDVRQA